MTNSICLSLNWDKRYFWIRFPLFGYIKSSPEKFFLFINFLIYFQLNYFSLPIYHIQIAVEHIYFSFKCIYIDAPWLLFVYAYIVYIYTPITFTKYQNFNFWQLRYVIKWRIWVWLTYNNDHRINNLEFLRRNNIGIYLNTTKNHTHYTQRQHFILSASANSYCA